MCRQEYAEALDKAVFPGLQGGPHNHTTAALAVALKEAATEEFRDYAAKIVENARALAGFLMERDFTLCGGGTDNHLILIDMTSKGLSGKQMSKALDAAGIVCNFNSIPFDERPPRNPSGIRIGTPAVTSRGVGVEEMRQLADWMERVAEVRGDEGMDLQGRREAYRGIAAEVKELCDGFPAPGLVYGEDGKLK